MMMEKLVRTVREMFSCPSVFTDYPLSEAAKTGLTDQGAPHCPKVLGSKGPICVALTGS